MGDARERVKKFVEKQRQQACYEEACCLWADRVTELRPALDAVVEILREGLVPGQLPDAPVAVLADGGRAEFPLVIAFGSRTEETDQVIPLQARSQAPEVGASAVFRCGQDGRVQGYRYPFHNAGQPYEPEHFVDLGHPAHIGPNEMGDAVADFLEWASAGAGCAGRPLHFWSPATIAFPQTQPSRGRRAA